MSVTISSIHYCPVKSVSFQSIKNCEIKKNIGIVGDRIFAFAKGLDSKQAKLFEKNPEERRGKWNKILTLKNSPFMNKYNFLLDGNNLTLTFKNKEIFSIFKSKIKVVKDFVTSNISKDALVGAYGAPAKAFTMFSYLGLDSNLVKFCVDTTPTKINKIFPVSNIPIISENELQKENYDTILVTAWNYKDEIVRKSNKIFKRGTKLIFPLPKPSIHVV